MAATEKVLGELHEALARELIDTVKGREEITEQKDEDGNTIVTKKRLRPSAAEMAVAAKFLKDNAITADPESNDALGKLKDALQAKPSKQDLKAAMGKLGADLLQ